MINLLHGDCLELMKTIPDNSIDMVLTDPPYGTTACKWDTVIDFELMWKELKRITKDDGAICLFGSEPFSSHLRLSNLKMFKYDWVWDKKRISNPFMAKKQPLNNIELISVFYFKQCPYFPIPRKLSVKKPLSKKGHNKSHTTDTTGSSKLMTKRESKQTGYPKRLLDTIPVMNNLSKDKAGLHPTQKPVALLEYLIKTYTLENETVLDFTMGSGSTGVACKNLNRKFIGIEQDGKYFSIAEKRINE